MPAIMRGPLVHGNTKHHQKHSLSHLLLKSKEAMLFFFSSSRMRVYRLPNLRAKSQNNIFWGFQRHLTIGFSGAGKSRLLGTCLHSCLPGIALVSQLGATIPQEKGVMFSEKGRYFHGSCRLCSFSLVMIVWLLFLETGWPHMQRITFCGDTGCDSAACSGAAISNSTGNGIFLSQASLCLPTPTSAN